MDPEFERLTRENAYLKQRCALLQGDIDNLNSQVTRLTEQLAHRRAHWDMPNPLSGGQDN